LRVLEEHFAYSGGGFFVSFKGDFLHFLLLGGLGSNDFMLVVLEDLGHAVLVTAFIIHEDVACLTSATNVAEHVVLTTMNVDIASAFIKMIVALAFQTALSVH
jgi:hypothetical protein